MGASTGRQKKEKKGRERHQRGLITTGPGSGNRRAVLSSHASALVLFPVHALPATLAVSSVFPGLLTLPCAPGHLRLLSDLSSVISFIALFSSRICLVLFYDFSLLNLSLCSCTASMISLSFLSVCSCTSLSFLKTIIQNSLSSNSQISVSLGSVTVKLLCCLVESHSCP